MPPPDFLPFLRNSLRPFVWFALFALAAEATARLDDQMRFGTSLTERASSIDSLKLHDTSPTGIAFTRGKPFGRYRTSSLNEHGFRSPSFEKNNNTGLPRIMILGASESFGFAESPGKSFAERLQHASSDRFQIVNASIVGLPLWSMHAYWDHWLADFHPDTVVILASPLFYLGKTQPPAQPDRRMDAAIQSEPVKANLPSPAVTSWWHPAQAIVLESKVVDRLKNRLAVPQAIVAYRRQKQIEQSLEAHGPDWPWRALPEDRIKLYREHLCVLVDKIQAGGSQVVLVTLPISAQGASRPEDQADWLSENEKRPRANSEVKWAFLSLVRDVTLEVGRQRNLPVIDLWKRMTGRRDYFFDLNHFSDLGAEIVAQQFAEQLETVQRSDAAARLP